MLAGDEKRIQALFCDLALEDRTRAPRFEKLWRGAESTAAVSTVLRSKGSSINVAVGRVRNAHWRDLRLFPRLSFAVITIFVILTVIALWTRSGEPSQPDRQLAANTADETSPSDNNRVLVAFTPTKPSSHKVAYHRPRRVRARDTIIQKAAAISRWQSPTGMFMESPADLVLKSLPQFNQSAKELESFLTDNEVKESNR